MCSGMAVEKKKVSLTLWLFPVSCVFSNNEMLPASRSFNIPATAKNKLFTRFICCRICGGFAMTSPSRAQREKKNSQPTIIQGWLKKKKKKKEEKKLKQKDQASEDSSPAIQTEFILPVNWFSSQLAVSVGVCGFQRVRFDTTPLQQLRAV